LARYVNHSCRPNTMTTGYGFEIALEDIAEGEEVTDEYGLFNIPAPMRCACGHPDCRGHIRADDADRYHAAWDARVQRALAQMGDVEQPLLSYLDADTLAALTRYLRTGQGYRSV